MSVLHKVQSICILVIPVKYKRCIQWSVCEKICLKKFLYWFIDYDQTDWLKTACTRIIVSLKLSFPDLEGFTVSKFSETLLINHGTGTRVCNNSNAIKKSVCMFCVKAMRSWKLRERDDEKRLNVGNRRKLPLSLKMHLNCSTVLDSVHISKVLSKILKAWVFLLAMVSINRPDFRWISCEKGNFTFFFISMDKILGFVCFCLNFMCNAGLVSRYFMLFWQ